MEISKEGTTGKTELNKTVSEEDKPGASSLSDESAASEGLTLEEYAAANNLKETDVWRMLRQGEIVGRTHRGQLIIYPDPSEGLPPLESTSEADLPPLPGALAKSEDGGFLSLTGDRSGSPEVALLLDHLSLAKEENREILKMTQVSIRKVTELSESVIDMKDAVIDAKDAQLQALKEQLKATDRQNAKLKQENEDLQMLARTLAESSPDA